MQLGGYTFPNLDYGYETNIRMPLHFNKLANGGVSVYDEGSLYDTFRVKGSCVLNLAALQNFYNLCGAWDKRGQTLTLSESLSTGFYPYTPAVIASAGSVDQFTVRMNAIERTGAVDVLAKAFRVSFEMFLEYTELTVSAPQNSETQGALTMSIDSGVAITGLRYPPRGFSPAVEHTVFSRQMLGGRVETVNYVDGALPPIMFEDRKTCALTLTANADATARVVAAILQDIRGNPFKLIGADGYHIFGNGAGEFDVMLSTSEVKVRHTSFDVFEISFTVAEV